MSIVEGERAVEELLEHSGIKGMRWGVRNERKAIKSRRKEILKEEKQKAYAKADKESAPLWKEAKAILKKYNLDGDDGGGGDGSPASIRAGKTYMKLGEKIANIEEKHLNEVPKNVSKRLLKEFGEQKLKDLRIKHSELVDVDDSLEHSGVKGMKWGVRKPEKPNPLFDKNGKRKQNVDANGKPLPFTKANGKSKQKLMTDAQLKKAISRMEMEKRYSELSKPAVNPGKKYVVGLLGTIGTMAVTTIGKHLLTKALQSTEAKAAAKKAAIKAADAAIKQAAKAAP